ncbi:MAG: VCBS repeat-containing protein, partial [Halobacteriales archaeon]|nr:VCBS repeat-containing protein [Halobacteriales archaeon]
GEPGEGLVRPIATVDVEAGTGSVAEKVERVSIDDLRMWNGLLDDVDFFHFAKFKVKSGHFLNEARDEYETYLLFGGLARLKSGVDFWIHTTQDVTWRRQATVTEDGEAVWKITGWESHDVDVMQVEQTLFAEVLDEVLDPDDLARARRSIHEEMVLDYLIARERGEAERPHEFFTVEAWDRQPGVAVVDLDRDGWDDFYVMERWGKNMFFRNRGDGTFDEIAGDIGLDIEDHTSSAIFADFDNDGDADAFLGRTLAPSLYLVNEGGRFVDRSAELVDTPLPRLVSSVTAVDYDLDGLLDLYVSTYAARMTSVMPPDRWAEYLPEEDAKRLGELTRTDHPHLSRAGPPNVLLRNRGDGTVEIAGAGEPLEIFRNTYQSTWADFDEDGDPDVYVANDFSPNFMFRNDGGTFVDITEETNTSDIGFGMGVSWGDYDGDGRQDLYVTNMYSKAGLRITSQLADLEPRFAKMARGNSLFRNGPDGFRKVSGLEAPDLLVENGGWGWGSQFADVDNDGYLDIYALSGYYTAPSQVELPVDI